jgi:hypothetical protein
MKSLLIIIPGAKNKKSPFFDFFLDRFYRYFGVDTGEDSRAESFKKYVQNNDLDVEIFNRSGGISETFSLRPAAEYLHKFINRKSKGYNRIILFGKSL